MTDSTSAQVNAEMAAATAEEAPIDMTTLFAMSVDATEDIVLGMRPGGRIVYANKVLRGLLGDRPLEELQSLNILDLVSPVSKELITGAVKRTLAAPMGETHHEDVELGALGWISLLTTAWPGASGEPALITAVGRDRNAEYNARRDLEEANRKLEESNRDLQDFAHIASHDLQEPLRKIIAFSDRLMKKYADDLDDDALDYLDRMSGASIRMQRLIEALLSFSRVGTTSQELEPTDLNGTLASVLLDLEVVIEETSAQIQVGELPTLNADSSQMRQLFQNLIGNALKFSKPDVAPVVSISASRHGSAFRIVVTDNGIGFAEKYQDKIFTVFQRLHAREEYDGSGIGLSICRRIVERHDGAIFASSSLGDGATFTITLPAAVPE